MVFHCFFSRNFFPPLLLTSRSYASNSVWSIVKGASMMHPTQQQYRCGWDRAFAMHSGRKTHGLGSHRFDCVSMWVAIKTENFRMHPCGCWSVDLCPNSMLPMILAMAIVHGSMVHEANLMINQVLCEESSRKIKTCSNSFVIQRTWSLAPCTHTYLKLTHCPIACKLLPDSRRLPFNLSVWSRFNVRNDRVDISEILLSLSSK